jgi:hypothetical protein
MRALLLTVVLTQLLIAGCASTDKVPASQELVTVDQVKTDPSVYDSRTIGIRGYIMADVMGSTSLYSTSDDALHDKMYDAIDILSENKDLREAIKYKQPTCVVAIGLFQTYKPGEFRFDMPSKTGVIRLTGVSKC